MELHLSVHLLLSRARPGDDGLGGSCRPELQIKLQLGEDSDLCTPAE